MDKSGWGIEEKQEDADDDLGRHFVDDVSSSIGVSSKEGSVGCWPRPPSASCLVISLDICVFLFCLGLCRTGPVRGAWPTNAAASMASAESAAVRPMASQVCVCQGRGRASQKAWEMHLHLRCWPSQGPRPASQDRKKKGKRCTSQKNAAKICPGRLCKREASDCTGQFKLGIGCDFAPAPTPLSQGMAGGKPRTCNTQEPLSQRGALPRRPCFRGGGTRR